MVGAGQDLPYRPAFSLLELMVAIVILGIGTVMVATIFPIGLQISAETLQMNIAQAVADAAEATLRLRIPAQDDFAEPAGWAAQVLVPDAERIDIRNADTGQLESPPEIDAQDQAVLNSIRSPNTPPQSPIWDPTLTASTRTRLLTEFGGWDGELNSWEVASIVPSQNLRPDFGSDKDWKEDSLGQRIFDSPVPPTFPNAIRAGLRRAVHLADAVYPPLPVEFGLHGATRRWAWLNPDIDEAKKQIAELAGRRYAWTAIHHRMSPGQASDEMLVTIVVTHRSDLNARFARQADLDDLLQPGPDAPNTDMLFPQPWLVMLNKVAPPRGEVECTTGVARLLPAGSYFVIAKTSGGLFAGTAHKVLACNWDSGQLQIARRPGSELADVPVYVFPPAIQRAGNSYLFSPRSPVVGVAIRRIAVQ